MEDLLLVWGGLAGFAALIALIVNILKAVGVVKDGQAQNWSAGLNLLGLAGILAVNVYVPDYDVAGLDTSVAKFVEVGVVVLSYVVQLLSSKVTHTALRGVPLVGKTYSG